MNPSGKRINGDFTVQGAADHLHLSERTVRRYLQNGRLVGKRIDMPAGGWQWRIGTGSVEALRMELQGAAPGVTGAGGYGMTADVKALMEQVATLTGAVYALKAQIEGQAPPATGEQIEALGARIEALAGAVQGQGEQIGRLLPEHTEARTWWQRLLRR